ncbi:uracil-DNA glycosylase family protein [Lysobacter ciconiae]|uniref:Uracil-DNA glycosylase family protein n=1 Tax=Novilysobacter ciconiae TaxID=2781022 RepID=A0A7S6UIF3_9GAMM|nr:uracil-DNA glycosylase family protein [Lysobacter ciconiae]
MDPRAPRATTTDAALEDLLVDIRACRICEAHLPLGPRPVLTAARSARLLIAGQAPGRKVHMSGVPWDDASGARLRDWLGIDSETFYDPSQVAIVPIGFCYPGKAGSGDAPPRPECRATWHPRLLPLLPQIRLNILIGQYAQAYFLGPSRPGNLTATMRQWRDFLPRYLPLPHPSPRNVAWFKANPWFEGEVLPELRDEVRRVLGSPTSAA